MMTLAQLCKWLPAGRLIGDPELRIERVHSDTRSLRRGDLFVALAGERFDAHDFLRPAKARGAAAALAQRGLAETGLPGVEVPDSRRALGELAAHWRAQFDLPLIAVTGSNGKTTVTQMIASVLRAADPEGAFATAGNFNNDIGVPLTLLRLRSEHRLAVVELGMNHPGEIAALAAIAKPTIALVNNAHREHMEFMASIEAVAGENGSVIEALPASGVAVFPEDGAHAPLWRQMAGSRTCITFGPSGSGAWVELRSASWSGHCWEVQAGVQDDVLNYQLHIAGRHNLLNSLAAAACSHGAGVGKAAIEDGLSAFRPVAGRSAATVVTLNDRSVTVIDDSYNANPDSVRAAIEVLAELPGPRLLVLGDMGEVGSQGAAFHAEVGALARERGIEQLFAHGVQSAAATDAFGSGRHFDDAGELCNAVVAELPALGSLLVKGSRFMRMERVVVSVVQAAGAAAGEAHAA